MEQTSKSPTGRIISAIFVALLLIAAAILVWLTFRVILVLFAGILFAIFLKALVDWTCRRVPIGRGWALGIVLLLMVGLTVLVTALLAPSISAQASELGRQLPAALGQLRATLQQLGWADWLVQMIPTNLQSLAQGSGTFEKVTGAVSSTLGAIADTALVIFIGIYGAAEPRLYVDGAVKLVPIAHRRRAREVIGKVTHTLRWWLIARVASMILVGVVTTIGLLLLDVPLAMTFGLLAALLDFIPNIGPIIAALPAILLALMHDPTQALYVTILYLTIQGLEGYILTPMIQQRVVALAPVLTLLIQVLLGVLAGGLGVAMATPLLAVIVVMVRMIYVQDILGDRRDAEEQEKETKKSGKRDKPAVEGA